MRRSALSLATRSASRKPRRSSTRRSASSESKEAAEVAVAEAEDAADLRAVAEQVAVVAATLATSGELPSPASLRFA